MNESKIKIATDKEPNLYRFQEPDLNLSRQLQNEREPNGSEFPNSDIESASDSKNLSYLSLGYKINALLTALVFCFPLIHLGIGIAMFIGSIEGGDTAENKFVGLFFIILATSAIIMGWTFAVCNWLTGKYLSERKNYLFCLVISGLNCMSIPTGLLLGIFTIVVLLRDSVKKQFKQ
ncbi:MAG: hypothetical protein ACK5NT_04805 [Pyrinomonadaceae bacterium]